MLLCRIIKKTTSPHRSLSAACALLKRDRAVTLFTQRQEVYVVVGTTLAYCDFVVNFTGGNRPALAFALLAQRMRGQVCFPYLTPAAPVPLPRLRITLKLLILLSVQLCVHGAVLFVRQRGATKVSARFLRMIRRGCHLRFSALNLNCESVIIITEHSVSKESERGSEQREGEPPV